MPQWPYGQMAKWPNAKCIGTFSSKWKPMYMVYCVSISATTIYSIAP